MTKKKILILIFTFLFCHNFYAQVAKEKEPLAKILTEIEDQFDCHFSYAHNTIADIFLEKFRTNQTERSHLLL